MAVKNLRLIRSTTSSLRDISTDRSARSNDVASNASINDRSVWSVTSDIVSSPSLLAWDGGSRLKMSPNEVAKDLRGEVSREKTDRPSGDRQLPGLGASVKQSRVSN